MAIPDRTPVLDWSKSKFFEIRWEKYRIYEDRVVASADLRWFWTIFAIRPGPRRPVKTDGRAPTLDEAKAQFRASWEAFKAYD